MLPSAHVNRVGVRVVSFRSSIAHPAYTPVYASLSSSRYQRKTRGRADRWSFLVRILHSLLHAGLARRTNIAIALIDGGSERYRLGSVSYLGLETRSGWQASKLNSDAPSPSRIYEWIL